MYSEVTISDKGWLITLGYELLSISLICALAVLSFEKPLPFRHKTKVKFVFMILVTGWQFSVAFSGIDYIWRFFNYAAWDDSTIRTSATIFFFTCILFSPDWDYLLKPEEEDVKNKE